MVFIQSWNRLYQLKNRSPRTIFITIYTDVVLQLTDQVCEPSIRTELDDPRCALQLTAKHIHQCDLTCFIIKLVNFYLVNTKIYRTQILLIRCDIDTVYMRTEITLCHTSDSLVEDLIRHLSDSSIFVQTHDCHFSVMPAAHKQIAVQLVRRQITSSHSTDRSTVHRFQIAIWQDLKRPYTFIWDRIQVLSIMRFFDVGRVVDRNNLTLYRASILHIQVVNVNSFAIAMGIGAHICHIFLLFHRDFPPLAFSCSQLQKF